MTSDAQGRKARLTAPQGPSGGPYAGFNVSAELYRLPSGDWECSVTAEPWFSRLHPQSKNIFYTFPNVNLARQQLDLLKQSADEMSQGPFIAPVTAY